MGTSESMFNFFENMNLFLTSEYVEGAKVAMWVVGILAFALTLVAAIMIKRGRVLGIIAAVMQLVGVVGGQNMVLAWSKIDFAFRETVYGTSIEDAQNKADAVMEAYLSETLPNLIGMSVGAMTVTLSCVFLLVYIVQVMKLKPKVLPVLALVALIIRFLFVGPVAMPGMLLPDGITALQPMWDKLNYAMILLPLLLLAILGILTMVRKKKGEPEVEATHVASVAPAAPAEVLYEAAPAEETPAEETPAEENKTEN